MNRTAPLLLALLFAGAASAQQVGPAPARTTKAAPADHALVAPHAQAAVQRHVLAPPTAHDFAKLRANNATQKRLQLAFARELPAALQAVALDGLAWESLADGSRVARIEIRSPGAAALRVALEASALPKGLTVRAYAPGELRIAHAPVRAGRKSALPEQRGDVIGLELHAAADIDLRGAALPVARLSHFVASPLDWNQKSLTELGASGPCNIDLRCHPDPTWHEIGKAVAKYVFDGLDENGDPGSFLCTGTLLNNIADDGAPLFTTANHCIAGADEAATMTFYWHFERATCGGAPPTALFVQQNTTTGGADLLTVAAANDMVLLELNQPPAPDTILSGWDANTPVRGSVVDSIHHPGGDLKKYATGTITDFSQYSSDMHSASGTHLRVVWDTATTEGGSSGAGLFNDAYALVGTLEGGLASCDALSDPDWFGRLDQAYDEFQPFLDPNGAPPPSETVTPVNHGETVHADLVPGEWHYYSITLPDSEHDILNTWLTVFSGDADLYLREGELPTENVYACRSFGEGTVDEDCAASDIATPSLWYIGVYAYDGEVSYALEVELGGATPPVDDDGGGGHAGWLAALAVLGWWRHRRQRWTTRSSSCVTPSGRR